MKYRQLANTGIFVSELCFGAMTFGGEGLWNLIGGLGQAEADRLVHRALDAGINFFDTANVYGGGNRRRSSPSRWAHGDRTSSSPPR